VATTSDKLPITMRVEEGCHLSPASPYDYELFDQRYRPGEEVEVTFHSRKSRQQEKFFWLKVSKIVENTDYPDKESLVKAALVRLGYHNSIRLLGHPDAPPSFLVEPRSLKDFDKKEFNEFVERFWVLLSTEIIPGLEIDAFLDRGKVFIEDDL
jgi:hypothetical protein